MAVKPLTRRTRESAQDLHPVWYLFRDLPGSRIYGFFTTAPYRHDPRQSKRSSAGQQYLLVLRFLLSLHREMPQRDRYRGNDVRAEALFYVEEPVPRGTGRTNLLRDFRENDRQKRKILRASPGSCLYAKFQSERYVKGSSDGYQPYAEGQGACASGKDQKA